MSDGNQITRKEFNQLRKENKLLKIALKSIGISFDNRRIKRLINELGIRSLMNRRFKKPGTHVNYAQRPNLIKNSRFNYIWCANITYLQLENGNWIYLSTMFDNKHPFNYIEANKKPIYLHIDIESKYTNLKFENVLKGHIIKHSYSIKCHPYDNEPIKAFH